MSAKERGSKQSEGGGAEEENRAKEREIEVGYSDAAGAGGEGGCRRRFQ